MLCFRPYVWRLDLIRCQYVVFLAICLTFSFNQIQYVVFHAVCLAFKFNQMAVCCISHRMSGASI